MLISPEDAEEVARPDSVVVTIWDDEDLRRQKMQQRACRPSNSYNAREFYGSVSAKNNTAILVPPASPVPATSSKASPASPVIAASSSVATASAAEERAVAERQKAALDAWALDRRKRHEAEQAEQALKQREALAKVKRKEALLDKMLKYRIEVQKAEAEGGLGIDVLQLDMDLLVVTRVKDGPILNWNNAHFEPEVVQAGDVVLEVNGATGTGEDLVAALKANQTLVVMLGRGSREDLPAEILRHMETDEEADYARQPKCVQVPDATIDVRIDRTNHTRLGVEVDPSAEGYLRVLGVGDGPVKAWNDAQDKADTRMLPGDIVVEVNGKRGHTPLMLEEMKHRQPLHIRLARCHESKDS